MGSVHIDNLEFSQIPLESSESGGDEPSEEASPEVGMDNPSNQEKQPCKEGGMDYSSDQDKELSEAGGTDYSSDQDKELSEEGGMDYSSDQDKELSEAGEMGYSSDQDREWPGDRAIMNTSQLNSASDQPTQSPEHS